MTAEQGDVIQIDGGLVIVTAIKNGRADVQPVSEFNGRRPYALDHGINPEISRDRLFEKRGADGLASFLAEQKELKRGKARGMIKLELGDVLCYEGRMCTVTMVDDKRATLGDLDGNEWEDRRWLNQFFFKACTSNQLFRLDAEARVANLKQFLAQRKSPSPGAETSDETEQSHIENMSTRTKKTKKAKTTTSATPKAAKAKSFAGSSTFIRDLIVKGEDKASVTAKVAEKYGMPERMITERYEAQAKLVAAKEKAAA